MANNFLFTNSSNVISSYTGSGYANVGDITFPANVSVSNLSSNNLTLTGMPTLTQVPNYRNIATISANHTVSNTYNEMSIGPITIADGVTVTVDDGANWVIV